KKLEPAFLKMTLGLQLSALKLLSQNELSVESGRLALRRDDSAANIEKLARLVLETIANFERLEEPTLLDQQILQPQQITQIAGDSTDSLLFQLDRLGLGIVFEAVA